MTKYICRPVYLLTRHLNRIQVSRPVCETYQHSDSCLLGDHITNALENVLAVGLLYIYN